MKKTILLILLICLTIPVFAEDKKVEDKEIKEITLSTKDLEGRAKIGVALGYPSGVVFGYRLANFLETNVLLGSFYNGFTIGGNLLFTIADIKIKDQSFPLSLGPQLNFHMGEEFDMSLMGFLRWEYTFEEIPLNLYIEGGPGMFFIQGIDLTWSTSLGVRYVF
ncbi:MULTISPECIES: hypothetical protein [unclassified Oceanispirochaeta]|uniref:hypothetical protein n=1 Tax=unclassified Oceanispirochaeta TaxID=2635722 RepID=UPI000E094292|nr:MULTISPECIES: hypothetical protein [unclassified Oceanispirochaeta]MBF9017380.1 hypothetical protein [Oceanispirochaeta sp. M2]NPD73755.1 hypothetical protein [Oceanispirochaeta sp. M1]RDG30507.1 hypothetical protein DV872_16805 [Oceanispirochaeta sp. M1]